MPNTPKKYLFSLEFEDEPPYEPGPETVEVVYPTTEHGRPPEEIKTPAEGKRRKLFGWKWEWENINK